MYYVMVDWSQKVFLWRKQINEKLPNQKKKITVKKSTRLLRDDERQEIKKINKNNNENLTNG
jgi:uncharacterized protein with WD repeat